MFLPELCIKRPVLATVMSLAIILIGVISFLRLPVREYPNIDAPVVSVRTVYPGASAEIMENQVTQPLEDSLSGVEGIKTIQSVSREEVSQITVELVLERDVDAAANDVRDRVSRVRGELPDETKDPVVAKVEADAQAIMWLALSSNRHSALEITDYADRYIVDRLQAQPGVASVIIGGERRYAMRLWLDRDRMAAYGLTTQDVERALRQQNVDVPSGRIESQQREFTVLTESDLRTPTQFDDLIIKQSKGYPIRFRDIGYTEVGAENERNALRLNGNPAIGLGVVKQSTANTLSVARAVRALLPEIETSLPDGMKTTVGYDGSIFIEKSIEAVYKTMLEALGLVVVVIFLFLRNWRATLIPVVTIPVALIGAFIFLYALGFTVNTLTLLGLVLAIGLVVDDAIVVLENIHRHLEGGMSPFKASLHGSREIAFAVVAMTMTLAAVFTPLAFMTGNTGRLFTEFAFTVAAAVIVSGFVALTLTPMMCSKLLHHEKRHNWLFERSERFFEGMNHGYHTILSGALRLRWLVVLLFLATIVSAGWLFTQLKSELSPLEDRGIIIGVMIAPEGSTLEYTDRYAQQLELIYKEIPEVISYFSFVAPGLETPNPVNSALSFVRLKPWEQRQRKQQEIAQEIAPKMFGGLPGVLAFPINPPSLGQSFRNPAVQFVIQASSYRELQQRVDLVQAKAQQYPGMTNVDSDLRLNKPQLSVVLKRDKIAAVGADVEEIGRTLETLLGGRQVTRFKQAGQQYDVIVQLKKQDREQPNDLSAIFVKGRNEKLVQLSNLIEVRETVAPKELNHFNRQRAAIISANIAPGYTLGEALTFMDETVQEVLGENVQTELTGQSREFRESGETLYITFVLALVFIYLVLSAQFESFVSPFVIMLTVPLAVTGALLALFLTGGTLNVYSQIGLVMLIGLITRNGILIVEFANQLRLTGLDRHAAVLESATLRLRPILMTTLATVLGAIPLALATGAGAESRQQIGWVIVGGLLLGTFLTLFVVPAAYTFLVRKTHHSAEEAAELAEQQAKSVTAH